MSIEQKKNPAIQCRNPGASGMRLLERRCIGKTAEEQKVPVDDQEQKRIAFRLWSAFETDPFEDGMYHPAEEIIERALGSKESPRVFKWLKDLSLDAGHPSFSSGVLHCLSHQTHPGTAAWRAELVRDALAIGSIEIRDATIQAAESWGGREMVDVLTSHDEPESWLREFIRDVIDDVGEDEFVARCPPA